MSGSSVTGKQRKYCVINNSVVVFRLSWFLVGGCVLVSATGLAVAVSFVNEYFDKEGSQRIVGTIFAAGVGGLIMLAGVGSFLHFLFKRCIVANKESDTLYYSPSAAGKSQGKILVRLSDIEAIQLCAVFTKVPEDDYYKDTTVYEINVVTNHDDNRRIGITSSQKGDQTSSDAGAFAEFLGVPLLDHTVT